jgi:uncharacterized phage infection (PIP) family protein YhgE
MTIERHDNTTPLAGLTGEIDSLVREVANDATADLDQAHGLLSQAIAELTHSFGQVAAEARTKAETISSLAGHLQTDSGAMARNPQLATTMAALHHSNAAIQAGLDKALGALQFEDMVSQIMAHISTRLAALTALTESLAQQGAALSCEPVADGCVQQLDRLSADLARGRRQMRSDDHRAVTQRDMADGDVELF